MNEVCCVFATVHLWEDSQQSTGVMCTQAHKHPTFICMQIYWLSTCPCTHTQRADVHAHALAHYVWPETLHLPNSDPFIYQTMCPVSCSTSLSIPFFFFPSFNRSLPWSYLLADHCPPPQITGTERLKGRMETVKTEEPWREARH